MGVRRNAQMAESLYLHVFLYCFTSWRPQRGLVQWDQQGQRGEEGRRRKQRRGSLPHWSGAGGSRAASWKFYATNQQSCWHPYNEKGAVKCEMIRAVCQNPKKKCESCLPSKSIEIAGIGGINWECQMNCHIVANIEGGLRSQSGHSGQLCQIRNGRCKKHLLGQ